jgi:GNAT superfamily N-acetyltransferase
LSILHAVCWSDEILAGEVMERMNSIDVRPLQEGDRPVWSELLSGYQAFYGIEADEAAVAAAWHRLHDPKEPMFGALATIDDVGVGIVHWLYHRSFWTIADYCYLQDLFVHESSRRQGAGSRLIEHVYAAATDAGCSRVYWLTHETNATAIAVYQSLAIRSGFVHYVHELH